MSNTHFLSLPLYLQNEMNEMIRSPFKSYYPEKGSSAETQVLCSIPGETHLSTFMFKVIHKNIFIRLKSSGFNTFNQEYQEFTPHETLVNIKYHQSKKAFIFRNQPKIYLQILTA